MSGSLDNLDLPKFYENFRDHVSNDFKLAIKIDDFIKGIIFYHNLPKVYSINMIIFYSPNARL